MDMKKKIYSVAVNHKKINISEKGLSRIADLINLSPNPIKDYVLPPDISRISGWFDFNDFYEFIINKFNNAIFVEIGTWKGKSIVFMAKRIKELNKNIKIFGIDTFLGNEGEVTMSQDVDIVNGTLYETYCKNIEPYKDLIDTIIGDSHDVYTQFKDESIDFLFIDGDHRYEGIAKDLKLWYPKIKYGGVIAGHDYLNAEGVNRAVNEFFKSFEVFNTTYTGKNIWFYKKDNGE